MIYRGEIIISIIISLIMAFTGFALAALSSKIKPGPLFGFRISYATVSRRVWSKANKLAGIAIGIVGLVTLPFGIIFGVGAQAVIMIISLTVALIFVTERTKNLAEIEIMSRPLSTKSVSQKILKIKPLRPYLKILILLLLIISLVTSIWSFLTLLNEGLSTLSFFMISLWSLPAYLGYLSLKRPEAYSLPWIRPGDDMLLAVVTPSCLSLMSIGTSLAIVKLKILGLYITLISVAILVITAMVVLIRSKLRANIS